MSPALVAEYQTALPPKTLLQAKLHELYEMLVPDEPSTPMRHAAHSDTRRVMKKIKNKKKASDRRNR
jgi:hypothetical protein